jgi:hypothetical protein
MTAAEEQALRQRVSEQARQLGYMKEALHDRNVSLDALHYVWCNGGCRSGVHRFDHDIEAVTEEIVAEAERNTKRLRIWWENRKGRIANGNAR